MKLYGCDTFGVSGQELRDGLCHEGLPGPGRPLQYQLALAIKQGEGLLQPRHTKIVEMQLVSEAVKGLLIVERRVRDW